MAVNIKARYVVDASFVSAYLLPDEKILLVEEIFKDYAREEFRLVAPAILYFEVLNSIRTAVVRKRIPRDVADELADLFLRAGIRLYEVDFKETFLIAVKEGITVYDASYVWLSHQLDIPLLTLDTELESKVKQF